MQSQINNMKKIIIMSLAAILASACCGEDVLGTWKALPLSPATNMDLLEEQIAKNPSDWAAVAKFIKDTDLMTAELGRHDITENGAYANFQQYDTRLEGKYEVHRAYIDVQIALSGKEIIKVAPLADAVDPQGEFDEQKDILFYADAANAKDVPADAENFVILFPQDAHMPCMALDSIPAPVRKVVFKIPYSE